MRLGLFLFFVLALFTAFYIVMRLPVFNISNVEVSGTEVLDADTIKAKAEESLRGRVYFFIPKSNLFFYKKEALKEELLKEMPRLNTLSLDLSNDTLHLTITEKKAEALWCNKDEKEKCFFVDEKGQIFSEAPDFGGTVYKKYYGGVEGEPQGKVIMSKENLEKIKEVYDTFDALKVIISKIEIVTPKEVRLSSIYDVDFLFNLDQGISETKENIETILTSERFKDSLPKLKGIEYIDFRFGGKVFFKKN